jgi:hypothetical protein
MYVVCMYTRNLFSPLPPRIHGSGSKNPLIHVLLLDLGVAKCYRDSYLLTTADLLLYTTTLLLLYSTVSDTSARLLLFVVAGAVAGHGYG